MGVAPATFNDLFARDYGSARIGVSAAAVGSTGSSFLAYVND